MKARISLGLCVAFVVGSITVRADDTPAQAAARAALEQKLNDLEKPQTQLTPGTLSGTVAVQPGGSATNVADAVSAKAATPQTAPAATAPAAAPVAEAPALVTPAVVAPAAIVRSAAAATRNPPAAAMAMPKPPPALTATKAPIPPIKAEPTNEIATATGMIYRNAKVAKVEPDGIIVSYRPAGGGLAMSKIYFDDLSPELRQQYEKK